MVPTVSSLLSPVCSSRLFQPQGGFSSVFQPWRPIPLSFHLYNATSVQILYNSNSICLTPNSTSTHCSCEIQPAVMYNAASHPIGNAAAQLYSSQQTTSAADNNLQSHIPELSTSVNDCFSTSQHIVSYCNLCA